MYKDQKTSAHFMMEQRVQRLQKSMLEHTLAPIPPQTNKEADCQDQFAQQLPLKAPVKQQGVRHANRHVKVKRKVQDRETLQNFKNFYQGESSESSSPNLLRGATYS